jgi:PleD family two-component response regulator
MGSFTIQSGDETSAMHLYQQADKALYMAKQQGRNRFISVV